MAKRAQHRLSCESNLDQGFRMAELRWLQENRDRMAAEYAGEWVAIDGAEFVAHAPDLASLLLLARQAGHPNPFITAIPEEPIVSLHV